MPYPIAPTTQNFASCVQLSRARSALGIATMESGCCCGRRREPRARCRDEVTPAVALDLELDHYSGGIDAHVRESADGCSFALDLRPDERAEGGAVLEIEGDVVEQHEPRAHRVAVARSRERRR